MLFRSRTSQKLADSVQAARGTLDELEAMLAEIGKRTADLPAEAQQKLFDRKHFRSRVQKKSLQLFGTEFGGAPSPSGGVLPDVGLLPPDDGMPKL